MPAPLTCNGLVEGSPCGSPKLINAHILPRGIADRVRRTFHNVSVTADGSRKAKAQLGIFDRGILCATCDAVLGRLDDYAIQVCDRVPKDLVSVGDLWALPSVDGDRYAKFVLAVIWRASISSLTECSRVSLGPYDPAARAILFDDAPLSTLPAFEVFQARFRSKSGKRPHLLMTWPEPTRWPNGHRGYGFTFSGFEVFAKVDSRPTRDDWKPFVVNGNNALRGLFKEFDGSTVMQFSRKHATRPVKRRR